MSRRRGSRVLVGLFTAAATVAAYSGVSLPSAAQAQETDTAAFVGLLDGLQGFVTDLGDVGRFSTALPGVGLAPGSAAGLGFDSLLSQARTDVIPDASTANTVDDLVGAINGKSGGISSGRTVSFTAQRNADAGTVESITIGMQVDRATTPTGFDLTSDQPIGPGYPPLSLSSADGVNMHLVLASSFVLKYDTASTAAWLASSPQLSVTATGSLPNPSAISAGLGILGVTLTGSTMTYSATINTTWSDPNNDGRLAFDVPGGAADDGELSAPGAAAGIVSPAISGSLNATLQVEGRSAGTLLTLPSVHATVTVAAGNFAADPVPHMTFDPSTFSTVRGFLTMSPRDLAQSLAQAAAGIVAAQRATGGALPFMRGSIGDAVPAVETLQQFLTDKVRPADPVTHVPGKPYFDSLQDLLTQLDGYTFTGPLAGADIAVQNASYSDTTHKVAFTLALSRAAAADEDLDPTGAPYNGTPTSYSATGLVDPQLGHLDAAARTALAGRQVVVGTSSGIVSSVSGAGVLTLAAAPQPTPDGGRWKGGIPSGTPPYAIQVQDPKTGLVEIGNAIKRTSDPNPVIRNANAKVAVAQVRPRYSVSLPLVLDLSDPDTTDCDPDPSATAPCPHQQRSDDAGTTIINALPLTADRIKLHTANARLFEADAPITTGVDIDATVGFVGVKLTGTLAECTKRSPAQSSCTGGTVASGDHLVDVSLHELGAADGADAQHDIPLPAFISKLTTAPTSVLTGTVKGQAIATLSLAVPGATDFFGGATPTLTLAMPDITHPDQVTVTAPELSRLIPLDVDPTNPTALFGALLANLQAIQGAIEEMPGGNGLDQRIPLLGKSFKDLIAGGASGAGGTVSYAAGPAGSDTTLLTDGDRVFDSSFVGRAAHVGTTSAAVVAASGNVLTLKPALSPLPAAGTAYSLDSELQGVVNLLQAAPPQSLQQLLDIVKSHLGSSSGVDFAVENPASSGDPYQLRLMVDWHRAFTSKNPVDLAFNLGGAQSLAAASASGMIDVGVNGEIKLTARFPLTASALTDPASNLRIDAAQDKSFINGGVSLSGDGVRVSANLGPFQASLGNPDLHQPAGTQLQAGLGVSLKNTTSGQKTLQQFMSGMGVQVTGDGVSCSGAAAPGPQHIALCGAFPAYLNGTKVNNDDNQNKFVIRLPVGTDLSDTFNLTGTVNGQPRFTTPAGLDTKLQSEVLNLLSFGEGFNGYLDFLKRALATASLDGKLPLVGKDLQAGSQFLSNVQTQLNGAFSSAGLPNGPSATIGALRDFLKGPIVSALPGAGSSVHPDVTCRTPLATAGTPTVSGPAGTALYQYRIVAQTEVEHQLTDTFQGPASTPAPGPDSLSPSAAMQVSWAPVANATGYKILRKKGATGGFVVYDTVTSDPNDTTTTRTYTDSGGGTEGAAFTDPAAAPCPDRASLSDVDGFTFTVDIGQGTPDAGAGCTGTGCLSATLPLDLGLPGLSIKATDATGGVTSSVGWHLHLKLGLSRTDGFYVATQDTNAPEFRVGASLDVPNTAARIAFLNVAETSNTPATPEFRGMFSIDLRDVANNQTDCVAGCTADGSRKLKLSAMTGSLADHVHAVMQATLSIDWQLHADVDAALPGIGANFVLHWGWASNSAPDAGGGPDVLEFRNVTIDPGSFLNGALGQIVRQVVEIFKPVQPILDTIQAPIPVISDLSHAVGGGDVTIASLAAAFSTLAGGPDIQPFLDVLKTIRDLSSALNGSCPGGGSFCVNVGSFKLLPARAMSTTASPATADSLIDKNPATYQPNNALFSDVQSKTTNDLSHTGAANGPRGDPHPGFQFSLLQHPTSIFGLLVGQDVEIATFDSGPLTLGFQFQKSFGPVYAPPPVNVVIGGGASVTLRVKAGFDTAGIRAAVESGKADATVLDSLYFATTENGTPIPVVHFEGYLQAGASVSAVVIEVGIVGGIKLTVDFTWNDPNNDGKFRFGEFLAAAMNNPICLFNVGGELSLFIKVFITLGIDPFSVSFDFTLIDMKLLDFSLKPDCTPPPPKLGGTNNHVLYLFAGKLGTGPIRGTAWPSNNTANEKWIVRQVPAKPERDPDGGGPLPAQTAEPAKVRVQALGITEDFVDDGITTVVLDGRGYQGSLQVMMQGGSQNEPFDKKAIVVTGNGKDVIRTGGAASYVDGGGENDQITTFDRPNLAVDLDATRRAVVAGGPGPDAITVGNQADVVMGDGSLVFHDQGEIPMRTASGGSVNVTGALNPANVELPADQAAEDTSGTTATDHDGDDQISAGLGGSTIYGGGGADVIGTANDSPELSFKPEAEQPKYRAHRNVIIGGSGSDRIKSGSADDDIFTGANGAITAEATGSGDGDDDRNTVDTGEGNDHVYGSNAEDFVTTHSTSGQTATVYGGGDDDVIIGGSGTDELYGGQGSDYLVARPATVSGDKPVTDVLGAARRVTVLSAAPLTVRKTLVGGSGDDRIYGADGVSRIFGDQERDECVLQTPASRQPAETLPAPSDGNDLIQGGQGSDVVQAGGGNDYVYGYGGVDTLCGSAGADRIYGGAEADLVYGGSGADKLYGDAAADAVYGGQDDDGVWGGEGDDRLEGNEGRDVVSGDAGADLVIGGSGEVNRADTGDWLYGDSGTDTLVGDNAAVAGTTATPVDLANTDAAPSIGGADTLFGGDGADIGYGGLADDTIYGGRAADQLEGNNGSDHVYGEDGDDNLIGGSSQQASAGVGRPDAGDFLYGGAGEDVATGDNAVVLTASPGSPLTRGRLATSRTITPLDLGTGAATGLYGGDTISGGDANDVLLGERGADHIHGDLGDDYAEGGQDGDEIDGDDGQDDLVGGSYDVQSGSGATAVGQLDGNDTIRGGDKGDVAIGDNGAVLRDGTPTSAITKNRDVPQITERAIQLYDLGDNRTAGLYGDDVILGQNQADVLLGQSGRDRILAGPAGDYAEGGPDDDWIEGGSGSDDLVGGSSTIQSGSGDQAVGQPDAGDVIWGQTGDDVEIGDNAVVNRIVPTSVDNDLTYRVGAGDTAGGLIERRSLRLLDLSRAAGDYLTRPDAIRYGSDVLSGQEGVDVLLGQDGAEKIFGGSDDDYVEGQGDDDTVYGDRSRTAAGVSTPDPTGWVGTATADYDADNGSAGQDDLLGGSSRARFRDLGDVIHGDGESDFMLGDDGTAVRDIRDVSGVKSDRIYALRYPNPAPAGAAKIRRAAVGEVSTRFCTAASGTAPKNCQPIGAFGDDQLFGENGDDVGYGQDGNDVLYGGNGDDDLYGELGDDRLFGEAGNDALLGDRGGVRDVYEDGTRSERTSINQTPALDYTSRRAGTVTRVVDLLHDVNGDAFVGSGAGSKMVYDGIAFGGATAAGAELGNDRLRGGPGADSLHGGVGDDLANGDSGGDIVFGDGGADVLWGGKGCDPAVDTQSVSPDCYSGGTFNPAARGSNDRFVDYVFGGKGATSGPSTTANGSSGSDVIDWRVRDGACVNAPWPMTFGSATEDPCSWFEMTDANDSDVANNQHHQGIDWQYGGWDRDVLQADIADNGPNPGDRLLDWTGAYNLYTHCNAAYGGFNDVREFSPDEQSFIQRWGYGVGAGQTGSDASTAGTSAFEEIALVYSADIKAHGSGKDYPSTPGHFDAPNACGD